MMTLVLSATWEVKLLMELGNTTRSASEPVFRAVPLPADPPWRERHVEIQNLLPREPLAALGWHRLDRLTRSPQAGAK